VTARLTALPSPASSIYGLYEQDIMQTGDRRLALGGDYTVFHRVRLYAEHEFLSSLAGPYALNTAQQQNATVFGIDARGSARRVGVQRVPARATRSPGGRRKRRSGCATSGPWPPV